MTKLSFNQIDKIIKARKVDSTPLEYDVADGTVGIEVKNSISVDEMDAFVNTVADALFVDGEYKPALKDIVFFKAELAYFTNVKTEGLSNERLVGLYTATAYSISARIDPLIRENLYDAVEARVRWTLDCALSAQKRRLDDAIAALDAEKAAITEKMDALIAVFERMASEVEGFNKEEIEADIKRIAGKSELEIARSVLMLRDKGADVSEPAERA